MILFSACQDDQLAGDGDQNGLFTSALLRIWDKSGFQGGHEAFMRRLQDELAGSGQTPNILTVARNDPSFVRQRPFSPIGTARTRPAAALDPVPDPAPISAPASDLLMVEDGEDDPDAGPMPMGSRALVPDVPAEIVARFRDLLAPLALRHFDPAEFLTLGGQHYAPGKAHGLNSAPPEDLWLNIIPTARVLDELRDRLGSPIHINSAYRNTEYNKAVRGEPNSFHMRFMACDITAEGVAPSRVADELASMRAHDVFHGGIGRYATFTHVDTRGVDTDWTQRSRTRGGTGTQVARLRRLAATIPLAPRSRNGAGSQALSVDPAKAAADLAQATGAVNGSQLVALDQPLDADLRRAVLYSMQFAQRAADADADPVTQTTAWWATYLSALAAVGWVVNDTVTRSATGKQLDATLDQLALEVMAGLVGANKLGAITAVLSGLKDLAVGDERLILLDSQARQQNGGAVQVGQAEVEGDSVAMTLGAVQFSGSDDRKKVLFAQWGKSMQSVWLAAGRLVLNRDFYFGTARRIIEDRLQDAEARILAFDPGPAPMREMERDIA
ncbi:MAG: D-Ala-D-Ala carboxypeptidase family metallohydrolase [Paracoccus sp. (in: a-proteobacteria)]|uniref:D-Ala-D-Ala carboxypeptidase family metallohydrolase n=1 Tax=Paracoccus sp. TaxID=267 RepID=UPI0039E6332D